MSRPITHAPLNVRYDEATQRYRDCRWCGGRGCLACPGEADKAYMLRHELEPSVKDWLTVFEQTLAALPFDQRTQQIHGFTLVSIAISTRRSADALGKILAHLEAGAKL